MAGWVRAGGGGIPSSLKTDMNAVLNKKFGTSTTYAPEDWPEDVNLLGPLPEKTVSGSIAHVEDGADTVPLKAWDVTVDANFDGVSSIEVTQAGKNLFDKTNTSGIVTGYIATSNFNDGNTRAKTVYIEIKGGATYTVSKTAGQRFQIATAEVPPTNGAVYTGRQTGNTASSLTITAGANDKYLWAWIFLEGTDTGTLSDMLDSVQIEVGSSASSYTAYTATTQYTASLGRTIYGGTADAVTGEGQATYKGYNLANLTWSGSLFDGNWVWYTDVSADGLKLPFASVVFSGICDTYTPTNYSGVSSNANTIALRNNGSLYVNNGSSETEPTGKVTIELATPEDFTFDPITPTPETALGVNNFWADEGDSEVTYRADINLVISALNNNRGLMMMSRPEEQEETEEPEPESDER